MKIISFEISKAFTYGDMRRHHKDKDKRNLIRKAANNNYFIKKVPKGWWEFRILVRKSGHRNFDIENVPKLFVDAFCREQISKDRVLRQYQHLAFYDKDTVDYVRLICVRGKRIPNPKKESTEVKVYCHTRD